MKKKSALRYASAIHYATEAFGTRIYSGHRGPEPYILHSLRVAERLPLADRVVAVLHDVLEDTDSPPPPWLEPEELRALKLVTNESETYEEYIEEIAREPGPAGLLARRVKMADLMDNLEHCRPGSSREPRYRAAIARLSRVPS